jgi:AcrR family transcriptional regulator
MKIAEKPAKRPRGVGRPRANPRRLDRPPQEEILLVASRLFAKKGFTSTTTREIAAAAGLRQPSVFHHFASKEAILAELLDRSLAPSLAFAEQVVAEERLPSVRLYRLIRFDVEHLCSYPFEMGAIFVPEARQPRFRRFWTARDRFFADVQQLVTEGIAAKELVAMDAGLATRALVGMNEATLIWYRRGGDWTPAVVAEGVAKLALRGLLRDPGRIEEIHRLAEA